MKIITCILYKENMWRWKLSNQWWCRPLASKALRSGWCNLGRSAFKITSVDTIEDIERWLSRLGTFQQNFPSVSSRFRKCETQRSKSYLNPQCLEIWGGGRRWHTYFLLLLHKKKDQRARRWDNCHSHLTIFYFSTPSSSANIRYFFGGVGLLGNVN